MPHLSGFELTYNITDEDISSLVAGARAANPSLIIGLNFRRPDNASWAVEHIGPWRESSASRTTPSKRWSSAVRSTTTVSRPPSPTQTARRADGAWSNCPSPTPLLSFVCCPADNGNRPRNYSLKEYYSEFRYYATQLRQEVPHWPPHFIQGAAYGGIPEWEADLPHYATLFDEDISTISVHYYPGHSKRTHIQCRRFPRHPPLPTPSKSLSPPPHSCPLCAMRCLPSLLPSTRVRLHAATAYAP